MIDTACDKRAWFRASCHNSDVQNHTASDKLGWEMPIEVRHEYTLDITLRAPNIYQNQPLYIDLDDLIIFRIQEIFTTRTGKYYRGKMRIRENR